MNSDPKILLFTVYRRWKNDYYDYFGTNAQTFFRPSSKRRISYGLRFLKQNVNLLGRYELYWLVMTRVDFLIKHIEEWIDAGFIGGFIGIESLVLKKVGKKESIQTIKESVELMYRYNNYVIGYYMIGYETDTVDSIIEGVLHIIYL